MSEPPKPKVFKPRAGVTRKSKLERDELAKQEAERAAARAAAAAAAQAEKAQAPKPTTKPPREKNTRDGATPSGMGIFGAGTGSSSRSRGRLDEGRSELLEGGDSRRPEDGVTNGLDGTSMGAGGSGGGGGGGTGGGGGGRGVKGEEGMGFDMEQEAEVQFIRSIDNIHYDPHEDDLQDEKPATAKGKALAHRSKTGMRPVRAPKLSDEHTNVAAQSKATQKQMKSNRTVQDDGDPGVADNDQMDLDEEPADDGQPRIKQDIPSSPELSKKRVGRRSTSKPKEVKNAVETAEEIAERLRLDEDTQKLQDEFIMPSQLKAGNNEAMDDNGKAADNEGKMFLFQFPPLVPFLADSNALPKHQDGVVIKSDPDGLEPAETIASTETTTAPAGPSLPQPKVDGLLTAAEPLRLPAGRIGKLRIHRSGKVSLDWGGTDMEVRYGTEVDFLQDAVLVETPAPTPDDGTDQGGVISPGTTYALGQVQKKMVVIPDWQKLYD